MGRFFTIVLAVISLAGCEQDRYVIGKDGSGNTIRLDRHTGQLAIIQSDQVRILKDAVHADHVRWVRLRDLEAPKRWEKADLPQIGARAELTTSWRDGKLYYILEVNSLEAERKVDEWLARPEEKRRGMPDIYIDAKTKEAELAGVMRRQPLVIELSDSNRARLLSVRVDELTRLSHGDGATQRLEARSAHQASESDYTRIAGWELVWNQDPTDPPTSGRK